MTAPDALLEALAEGLRRRVVERRRAEERLADFVFLEGTPDEGTPDPGRDAISTPADWRHFVVRTLGAAGDPGAIGLLEQLAGGDRPVTELAGQRPAGVAGRLATVDWIGGLASAGLVRRELETDRVGLTDLGAAVLAFVQEWERRAAAGDETAGDEAAAGRRSR